MIIRPFGETIRLKFTTTAVSTGSPVAPSAALTSSDFRIYKDGSATEKTTTNGITVTSPFDSVVGRHLFEVDTNNATGDAGFWAPGSLYIVELSTSKTVDSQSVSGLEVGRFRLEDGTGKATAGTTSTITLGTGVTYGTNILTRRKIEIIGGTGIGQARMILSNTNATPSVVTVDNAWTTNPDTTSCYRIFGEAGADVRLYQGSNVPIQSNVTQWNSSNVATPDTAGHPKVTIKTGTGTGEVLLSSGVASVNAVQFGGSSGVFSSGRPEVNTTNWGGVSVASTGIRADVISISGSALAAGNSRSFFDGTGYAGTNNTIPTVTNLTNLPAITPNWLTASGLATDAVNEIADGVWDEVISGHLTGGTTGAALNAAGSAGDPWVTVLPGAYTGTQAGKMLSDILTDAVDIQSRLPSGLVGGKMEANVGSMSANTVNASALASDAVAEIQAGLSTLNASGVRSAIGLSSANLDTQISSLSSSISGIPSGVWNSLVSDPWSSGTFGKQSLISLDANRTIQLSSSYMAYSDVYNIQSSQISIIKSGLSVLTTGDIRSAIGMSTNNLDAQLLSIKDYDAYSLAILAGNCSNAGTATEAYSITLGSSTYTVSYTGLTEAGNRSTTGFVKT